MAYAFRGTIEGAPDEYPRATRMMRRALSLAVFSVSLLASGCAGEAAREPVIGLVLHDSASPDIGTTEADTLSPSLDAPGAGDATDLADSQPPADVQPPQDVAPPPEPTDVSDAPVPPDAPEVEICVPSEEDCDGADNDCDGEIDEGFDDTDGDGQADCVDDDDDGDGDPDASDCSPHDPAVHNGAAEACNGSDDDCDGAAGEVFPDEDGDGIGDACEEP